jgi:DNA (cytosine-5)-methyltransferase 1
MERTNPVAVSLFSGCGGLDLGLELAGVHVAVCVENDLAAQATLKANRPGVVLFDDVRTVTGQQLRAAAGGHVDILAGGPPCQSFSTIGHRGSTTDERGQLLMDYLRILKQLRPECFVMENVNGILSSVRNDEPLFPWLLTRLRKLGYNVAWWQLNAANYGSPQKRIRVVIAGSRTSQIRQPQMRPGLATLREAILSLEANPGECARFTPRVAAVLERVPAGGDWRDLPTKIQNEAMGNANRKSGGLTSYYRRLSYDRPSPTLMTSPVQRATTLCHPVATRPLSIAEYARIQGFPDDWQFCGSTAAKYRQIGNAVPVQLAEAIGNILK